MNALPQPQDCCTPCETPQTVSVPGPQGVAGPQGDQGDQGDQGIQGIEGIQGIQGVPGPSGGVVTTTKGDLYTDLGASTPDRLPVGANGRTLHANSAVALGIEWRTFDLTGINSLITGTLPVANGGTGPTTILPIANGGTAGVTAAAARTNLGLAIGTNVQAYDADLTTWAGLTPSANAQSLVTAANYAAMLVLLGKVLARKGLLAKLTAVDMNATADTSMGIVATRFRVTEVIVEAATATLATAPCTGGLFRNAGGLNPIAADQTLAACVLPINFRSLTLGGIGLTDVFIADLIFRVGTPAGFAATANVWVMGEDLS